MALINSSIPNLINGVSQQPPSLRLKTQCELQENGVSSVVTGLSKRPSTSHIADLGNLAGASDAFIHTIRRDQNEYYTLVISTTQVKVYDKNGVEKTVTGSASYLSGLTTPSSELAATTVADYTFILNKNKTVAKAATTSASRNKEALLYVKQGDYSTKYTVTIVKNGTTYKRELTTMASTQDSTTLVQNAEKSIQTDRLAENLVFNNTADTTYYTATGTGTVPNMTFTQFGSVIYMTSTDDVDFTIDVEDSRGNNHIFAFKDKAADFKKLPPNGLDGFVIAIVGDNSKGQDDYYVKLEKTATGGQVWQETIAPNVQTTLDNTTMPHQLISNADGTFTLQATTFKTRQVGDDTTNPFPSFVDHQIKDIFFHRNRLGLLADENIILSEAGEFTAFNYFKRTTLTILDSDPIDLAVSNNKVSLLKHAVPFNESLLLFSDLTQFKLTAEDLLSPETVAVDVSAQFEASLTAKPVGAGRFVFFGIDRGTYSGIREYFVDQNTETDDAVDITSHVPNYLEGDIRKLEASSNEDMLLVLTEDDKKTLYTYTYYWRGEEKLQSAWSKWTFGGDILNISFNKSDIDLLIKYTATDGTVSVCLERMTLSTDASEGITEKKHPVLLDRRQTWTSSSTPATLTLANGSEALKYIDDKGAELTQSEATTYVGGGGTVFVGIPYTFRYVFSEQVMKSENEPMSRSRLQLRNMTLLFNDTGYFEVVVTPSARNATTTTFSGRVLGSINNLLDKVALETDAFKFNVLSKASEVAIEIKSSSYLPAIFQSAEWEGFFVMRSRRV
tara:strand:- start:6271 stop:8634 length:2364 start_codon:yes stop_codon:yes gene_type:complete